MHKVPLLDKKKMKQVAVEFKDGRKGIKVGDIIYVTNMNRYQFPIGGMKIKSIGRKLFHLENGMSFYFDGIERSDYSHNTIWSSEMAFGAHKHKEDIVEKVCKYFSWENKSKLSGAFSLKELGNMLSNLEEKIGMIR